MVKTYENLELFVSDSCQELSILESRKYNQAVVCSNSGGLQSRSTPIRMACAKKQAVVKRGLRKSSSLTNGMGELETKVHLESMAKKARGLLSKHLPHLSMRPSWASADALSTAPRRRH
jgi:hypothetical protein